MKLTGQPQLFVRVLSPTKTLFEGNAFAVSAINEAGPFDILADHANFFSLLTQGDVAVITSADQTQVIRLPINKGLLKVTNNQVTLFVDIEAVHIDKDEQGL